MGSAPLVLTSAELSVAGQCAWVETWGPQRGLCKHDRYVFCPSEVSSRDAGQDSRCGAAAAGEQTGRGIAVTHLHCQDTEGPRVSCMQTSRRTHTQPSPMDGRPCLPQTLGYGWWPGRFIVTFAKVVHLSRASLGKPREPWSGFSSQRAAGRSRSVKASGSCRIPQQPSKEAPLAYSTHTGC